MLLASLSSRFTLLDWGIVAAYLVVTTVLGAWLAGKQASIRDFFLGGRKLPWYAVSGSIIATEISAVTFVIVPFIVFRPGGNMTYLQLGVFGAVLSRFIVAYWLVPAYYQREIYSPYDYMGNQLGGRVRSMTSVLFALGGVLAQSARVYLTAEVLVVVLHDQLQHLSEQFGLYPLAWAIVFIAIVAVAWTLIGGISTVIWTDAMLFLVFLVGAVAALAAAAEAVPGGFGRILQIGWEAKDSGPWGKFTFFDFSANPTRAYTIWTAVIATTWGGVGAYGTDQLIAQRIFCCRGESQAKLAIITSAASQIVTITVALLGVGLYAYYTQPPAPGLVGEPHPDFPGLVGDAAALYRAKGDRILPIFIVEAIPVGMKGLIIAGIFAAAVSSLTSILAALSQTVMSAFYQPWKQRRAKRPGVAAQQQRHEVFVSRMFVLGWGVVLAAMAFLSAEIADRYKNILDLALAMAGYTAGALLAGFFLGFLPLKINGRGYMYSAPLSVLCVYALIWHDQASHVICWTGAIALLGAWCINELHRGDARPRFGSFLAKTGVLLLGVALLLGLNYFAWGDGGLDEAGNQKYVTIAWPWQTPIGSVIAFVWGWALADRRPDETGGAAAGQLAEE
ncbi:MAG: hypothetical protein D6744_00450 [Planctomycetota bacterium]|nr:MAG: hypothetical protein D6744_00450 [Planctomycetota bacterium]